MAHPLIRTELVAKRLARHFAGRWRWFKSRSRLNWCGFFHILI
jgi:hypothetical protein